ncbi:hypothetical protein SAMN05216388_10319 [Halorientalis persicus]|uniref:Uncharacterized protein n=1 Tax=Halorientalis persicus TaxID=1367881 RepID=A0A1H8UVZ4_9EURY|nr:hypothetical protein SAMN05216388_10319 [Halorientalis persicus]
MYSDDKEHSGVGYSQRIACQLVERPSVARGTAASPINEFESH